MPFRNNVSIESMSRRKKHEEHENLERWLVSYADFITLLFAFFVVMYSISSINEGKYRVLSDSISSAFTGQPAAAIKPIKMGEPIKAPIKSMISEQAKENLARSTPRPATPPPVEMSNPGDEQQTRELNSVADEVDSGLKELVDQNIISVKRDKAWVEVEINTSILFGSGSAGLQPAAMPVMRTLAKILGEKKYNIQVEGFTDNVPIKTEAFPSNWELSAARAASVVRVFADDGVSPQRLAAIGFGEHRPITDNSNEDNRKKNRRVRLVILPPGKEARDAQSQTRMFGESRPSPEPAVQKSAIKTPDFNFSE